MLLIAVCAVVWWIHDEQGDGGGCRCTHLGDGSRGKRLELYRLRKCSHSTSCIQPVTSWLLYGVFCYRHMVRSASRIVRLYLHGAIYELAER